MKKLILSLVLISFSTAVLFAQTPDKVQGTFKSKYPDATGVVWSTGDDDTYMATYTDKSGNQNVVVLNEDGKIVRTEASLNQNDYPGGVKEYYVKKYPDEKDYHVWIVTDENGNKTYYTREHGARIWFDKAGNYVKEEKEKVKNEMKEHSDDK